VTLAIMAALVPQYGPQGPLVRSRLDVQSFLRSLDVDYVTSMNEYLPKTVKRTVPRFGDVAHVIAGAGSLSSPTRSPGRYDVAVDAAAPVVVEFNAHWFPGWRARVDGAPVAIGPDSDGGLDDGGLIRVRVPPGRHEIALVYGRTPLRLACDLVSLGALVVVLALLGRALLRSRRAAQG